MKVFNSPPSFSEGASLKQWGEGVRARRIERQETQAQTAARLGLSVSAYRRIESGCPGTAVGHWIRVLALCQVLPALNAALEPSLFSEGIDRRRVRKPRAGA
jgi:transcriptional regulator with XRE-family HTH domain